MASRLSMGIVAASLAAMGCQSTLLVCPHDGGSEWTAVATPHLVVETDMDASRAGELATDLEALRAALARITGRLPSAPSEPVEVIVFADPDAFHAFDRPGDLRAAYFAPRLAFDLEPSPTLVLHRGDDEGERGAFLHELTHRFLQERFADPPVWLSEGFAEYFETLRMDGQVAVLGEAPRRPVGAALWSEYYGKEGTLIPLSAIPDPGHLVMADRDTFYATEVEGPKKSEQKTAHYAGAFRLVHLLKNGANPEYRARFSAFLAALDRGSKPTAALREAFAGVDPGAFEHMYRDYVSARDLPVERVDLGPAPPPPPLSIRTMTDAEVHVLWSRLYPREESSRRYIHGELDLALAHEPSSIEVRLRRALVLAAERRFEGAEADIGAVLAARPYDPRVLLGRLSIFAEESPLVYKCGQADPKVDAVVDRLSRVAVTGVEFAAVASYDEGHGRVEHGLVAAREAVRRAPLCWSCQDVYALLLFEAGDVAGALAANTRAQALLPERADEPRVREHRRMFESGRPAPNAPCVGAKER
ncbi:MAG: hypothetical protein U0359_10895 [Byssovorax sp.]